MVFILIKPFSNNWTFKYDIILFDIQAIFIAHMQFEYNNISKNQHSSMVTADQMNGRYYITF